MAETCLHDLIPNHISVVASTIAIAIVIQGQGVRVRLERAKKESESREVPNSPLCPNLVRCVWWWAAVQRAEWWRDLNWTDVSLVNFISPLMSPGSAVGWLSVLRDRLSSTSQLPTTASSLVSLYVECKGQLMNWFPEHFPPTNTNSRPQQQLVSLLI